jgi:DNA-binding NtrC family response regulator
VSATNKDLERAVSEGAFREDLFFRLNVIPIALPPLRERAEDVPALVRHFSVLHRARTGRPLPRWTDDALVLLTRYRWPGNVRELANIVERLAILHAGQEVSAREVQEVLPVGRDTPSVVEAVPRSPATTGDAFALAAPLSETLDDYERELIARALSSSGGNIAEAARRLQTDRPNLYRRMRRLGLAGDGA